MIDFKNIAYLQNGKERQKKAWTVLTDHSLMQLLAPFDPVLTGTIPINIDIETSDLDIICCWNDKQVFVKHLRKRFSGFEAFELYETNKAGTETVVCRFRIPGFEVEIFGQDIPVTEQYAYRHMIVEYKILEKFGEDFRKQVIALKKQGLKTEPAFGRLLGLTGDPYEELLEYEV